MVPAANQMSASMLSETNRTLPSHRQTFTPPRMALRAVVRHDAPPAPLEGGPLDDLLQKLGRQFDLVQAVQFPHRGQTADEPAAP